MENHKRLPWHASEPEAIYKALHTSEEGLSDAEAAERLAHYGRNELRQKPKKTIWQMIKSQITDPMVLILIGAAVFSAILREWTEAIVILTIVIINAVIGIVQERKAESLSLIHILVEMVNETEVSMEDRLSNSVYLYSREKDSITIAHRGPSL